MAPDKPVDVLIVERDAQTGRAIADFLGERGFKVSLTSGAEQAYNRLDERAPDIVLSEYNVQHGDGMRLLGVARERNPEVCFVFIADEPEVAVATEAMREGAYDFLQKPVSFEKLAAVLERGLDHQRLLLEQAELRRRLDERFSLGSLVGRSRAMVRVYAAVRQAGPSLEPILIQGEDGTGKESIAQSIHTNSPRRDAPFVKIECSGFPEAVLASALFGQAHGESAGPGRFELADGGTLFISDVDALSPGLQAGVLRALREGVIERIGGDREIPVNVRLIATCDRSLLEEVDAGRFNAGLHAHLAALTIASPALRDRREDISIILQRALERANESGSKHVPGFTRLAIEVLAAYPWPGNLRELETLVEGLVVSSVNEDPITVTDLPGWLRKAVAFEDGEIRLPVGAKMEAIEREAIAETMKASAFNKEQCARTLGIGLRTLYRKLKAYDIA